MNGSIAQRNSHQSAPFTNWIRKRWWIFSLLFAILASLIPLPTSAQVSALWFHNDSNPYSYMMHPAKPINSTKSLNTSDTYHFFSDRFSAGQSLPAGSTTVYFYATNAASSNKTVAFVLFAGSSGNYTKLGEGETTIPAKTTTPAFFSVSFHTNEFQFTSNSQIVKLAVWIDDEVSFHWDGSYNDSRVEIPSYPGPTKTATRTSTPVPSATKTPVPTSTHTAIPSATFTHTAIPSATFTPAATATDLPTEVPTGTEDPGTAIPSPTHTPKPTKTNIPESANTQTPIPTSTQPPPTATSIPTSPPASVRVADPAVEKLVDKAQASVGEVVTFTLKVTNRGNVAATNVVVTDTFASFLDITSTTISRGTVAIDNTTNQITADIGTLRPEDIITITIKAKVNASATVTADITNFAILSHNTGGSSHTEQSNIVRVRILGAPVLPNTGFESLEIPSSRTIISGLAIMLLLSSLLGVLGLLISVRRGRPVRGVVTITLIVDVAAIVLCGAFLMRPDWLASIGQFLGLEGDGGQRSYSGPEIYIPASTPAPLETLPDFPIPDPSEDLLALGGANADRSAVQRIAIPSIEVDAVVKFVPFDGHTWQIRGLRDEVAWLGETSWPGLGSNTALAAHVTVPGWMPGPFHQMENLVPGDEITLYTEHNRFTYAVRGQFITDETNLEVLDPTLDPQLTLLTCTQWDRAAGIYRQRLVVTADLIHVEPIPSGL